MASRCDSEYFCGETVTLRFSAKTASSKKGIGSKLLQRGIQCQLRNADPLQIVQRLLAANVQNAAVKLGAMGCLAQALERKVPLFIPALKVETVDTMTADNAFNTVFLTARIVEYQGTILDKADW